MNRATIEQLIALNTAFYHERAGEFDASRQSPWPGWERLLSHLDRTGATSVLDIGCGNGRFGRFAVERLGELEYWGVDSSRRLLDEGRRRGGAGWNWIECEFVLAPLADRLGRRLFDLVACFGVLHHVPGEASRQRLLERLAKRLKPGGLLALSFWQFGREERFLRRVLPWSELIAAGGPEVDETQLERGDFLLRWGAEDSAESALRFCHYCDGAETRRLTGSLGLSTVDDFESDGQTGRLNRYVVLRRH